MLITLAIILFVAWILGLVGVYTIGAFVHLLLVAAIIVFILNFIGGSRSSVA